MSTEITTIKKIIPITNEVSETFCYAKWYHTTIYLHMGETHSCYHPAPHSIPLHELTENPGALHNTLHKKKERALMLVGEKPNGCQYCWNVESLGDDYISDRHIRNASLHRKEFYDEINNNSWDQNIYPDYIEVSFSNECNFKCGYCHPKHSSSFYNEIKSYGPYTDVSNHANRIDIFKIYKEETNPYIEAWWKWWPTMSKRLNILRITGGEPLLHRSTWRLFEHLRNEPKPHLELNLNSNFGAKTQFIEKLSENVNDLLNNKKIKAFKLFSSMETWGDRAEYIRTGLDINLWEKNLDTYLCSTKNPITFMCTFNILTVTSFTLFLEKVLEWRNKYKSLFDDYVDKKQRIKFDTPYLKEPLQFDMLILPKKEFLPYFDNILKFIENNKDDNDFTKFTELEYERFRRIRDYFATKEYSDDKVKEGRSDFYNWFSQYDERRNLNFKKTFPEMVNFFEESGNLTK